MPIPTRKKYTVPVIEYLLGCSPRGPCGPRGMSSIINCEWALTSITKSSIHGPLILGRRFHMEERNPMEGKARIVGLDLSKKTFGRTFREEELLQRKDG